MTRAAAWPAVSSRREALDGPRPALERLRIVARVHGVGFDLRREADAGPAVTRLSPAPHVVILDAVLRRGEDGGEEVVTSEFDVALERGRVVRWSLSGPGAPASAPLFDGPPGSVLWWLREREGRLEVRDVRHGATYALDAGAAPRQAPSSASPY